MIKIRRQQCEKKESSFEYSSEISCLSYLLKKKKQLLERPNTDEMERGEAENSNERSRRKFVRFLEWNPLSRLCIWGNVDKALPSLRQLMTQSGSGWLSLYKGLGYTRGRTSQCAECTCLAAFINTVARTQLRTSERERIPRRVLLRARSFSKFVRQSPSPLDIYLQLSRFLVKAGLNVNFWNRASTWFSIRGNENRFLCISSTPQYGEKRIFYQLSLQFYPLFRYILLIYQLAESRTVLGRSRQSKKGEKVKQLKFALRERNGRVSLRSTRIDRNRMNEPRDIFPSLRIKHETNMYQRLDLTSMKKKKKKG